MTQTPNKQIAAATPLPGLSILLAEDNVHNEVFFKALFSVYGWSVDTVPTGKAAVDKLSKSASDTYDLVLMDLKMPVMDGYEATRAIRKLDSEMGNIPVVALTAFTYDQVKIQSVDAGIDDIVEKPLNTEKFIATLTDVLLYKSEWRTTVAGGYMARAGKINTELAANFI